MTTPATSTEPADRSLVEFFADLEHDAGPSLTADEHRALTAAVRNDRERTAD